LPASLFGVGFRIATFPSNTTALSILIVF